VTALEPSFADQPEESIRWLQLKVEDYCPDRRFHWINVRHSAYYFRNVISEIARLAESLSPGGMIAITHWASDCILRRLHLEICGHQSREATAGIEDLARRLTESYGLNVSPVTMTETALDVKRASEDATVAAALSRLACRGTPRQHKELDAATEIASLLYRLRNNDRRRNGIMFVHAVRR
jgi:hypothetical protein